MNIVSPTNVSKARRPRSVPGARPAPSRGISRGRSSDDRGRQQNQPGSSSDDGLTPVTRERPNP